MGLRCDANETVVSHGKATYMKQEKLAKLLREGTLRWAILGPTQSCQFLPNMKVEPIMTKVCKGLQQFWFYGFAAMIVIQCHLVKFRARYPPLAS